MGLFGHVTFKLKSSIRAALKCWALLDRDLWGPGPELRETEFSVSQSEESVTTVFSGFTSTYPESPPRHEADV